MLYHVFFKNSLAGSMEYRANFLMAILVECAFLLIKLLYVIVSYQMDLRVNGLTPDSILLFVGTYTFITGIMSLIYFPNFLKIPYYVQDGTLDIYLTKPVSLQFMISFRYIDFGWAIPNIFGGIAMIAIAFVKLDLQLRIGQILGFILYWSPSPLVNDPYIIQAVIRSSDSVRFLTFAINSFCFNISSPFHVNIF